MIKFIAIMKYAALACIVMAFSVWLLLNVVTWVGKGIAVAIFTLAVLPATIILWRSKQVQHQLWQWVGLALVLLVVAISVAILVSTPSGNPSPDSPISHQFTGDGRFPRYTLTNIVPETEQVNLGFWVMGYLDSILTWEQVDRVCGITIDLYQDMEADAHFRELGSVMGWAYTELIGLPYDVGHYYLYVPSTESEEPLPAIVFLHGSAGNFKAYMWVWSQFAEKYGYAIIAPSYGFGNWGRPDSIDAALSALDDAMTKIDIDTNQVFLAGLSNGGLGVSQAMCSQSEQFRGFILISPVMAIQASDQGMCRTEWIEQPVLIVSGEADRRIPISYVEQNVTVLRSEGAAVTHMTYPEEDHFLFFSQPDKVLENVSDWLLEIEN